MVQWVMKKGVLLLQLVNYLIEKGVNVKGPFAPDSLFSEKARKNYDIVICMYHDQGLIPIKAIDFEETVNVSIGLPSLELLQTMVRV